MLFMHNDRCLPLTNWFSNLLAYLLKNIVSIYFKCYMKYFWPNNS